MSAVTKTTIELTPAQKIAITRLTAQRQLETGETYSQSQFLREAMAGDGVKGVTYTPKR